MQNSCVSDLYNLLLSDYTTANKGLMPVLVSRTAGAFISSEYSATEVTKG